ncbi:MAG TPA: NADH-quinone oxidoreductase subunit C [Ferruginibacter sp.]|nr:NADH-quinone oxidoreductase subunit C [Ferruginibacter sp.]
MKTKLTELLATATFDETGEWLSVAVDPTDWPQLANKLRHEADLQFNYLFCVTCVDWKTHLSMVYHLSSTSFQHNIVIKCILKADKPQIETVSHLWKTAEFHEREAYEMFGVDFINHPDLRLLILPDGWEGRNPMRKDFEDPVNMIKL